MRLLGEILVGLGGWAAFAGVAFAVALDHFHDLHESPRRGWWVARLNHDGFGRRYRELLAGALDWLDARLSPGWPVDLPGTPADKRLPRTEPERAWSHGLLGWCLLLAVVYPILSVVVSWAVTGNATGLGAQTLFGEERRWWERAALIGLLGATITVGYAWRRVHSTRLRRVLANVWFVFAISTVLSLDAFEAGFEAAFETAFAGEFAAAGAVAIAIALAGAPTGAIFCAYALAVAVAVGAAVGATAELASVGAGAGAAAAALAQEWIGQRTGRPRLALAIYAGLLLVVLAAVVLSAPSLRSGAQGETYASAILFLGFLPLLNAAADFGSTGLTRWWLRKGLRGHLWLNAFADLLAAVAILLLLGFAMIATVHFIRPQDGRALADLPSIFADLRGPEAANYYWLYFCFFSTLLPTALHGLVACFGAFTLISGWLGRPIAAGLMSDDTPTARFASLLFSACVAAAVVVPAWLIWLALAHLGRPALDSALWVFEGFARGIGAI